MTQTLDETVTWVAVGPAGAVGSIHLIDGAYKVEMFGNGGRHGVFPSLDAAKSAVHAALGPLADRPDFRAH